ncbi:MAG TPA: hypothetical protein VK786_06035 [bacterium]|nr:hypothetical protein [bacterium]
MVPIPLSRQPDGPGQGRARDLTEFIGWLRLAVDRLKRHGLDFDARLKLLRGIYYGSAHSLDFEKRRSGLRNLGFNLYLRTWPPPDPVPLLGAGLVRALKDSSEVAHQGRLLDIGHVFVGLEARSRLLARNLSVIAQGGTGLELATWVGDLGGAAGLLAVGRMDFPRVRAADMLFSRDTYDLSANLEGDLAGYLVGRDPKAGHRPSAPDPRTCRTVPDAIEGYLSGIPSDWSQRYRLFSQMIGASVEEGRIANREILFRTVLKKTAAFASFYLVYRLRSLGRLSRETIHESSRHIRGAAAELSEIFVGLLEQGLAQRQDGLPKPADPEPSPAGEPDSFQKILGLAGFMVPRRTAPHT